MSRQSPREDEIFVRKHFENYLVNAGIAFGVDENYSDSPDWVMISEGKRIGCEFATVTVEKLVKWAKHKQFASLKQGTKYVIVIPIEPHMWIQRILSEKNSLVPRYIKRACLDECWLVLHCGSNRRQWFIPFDEGMLEVFRAYSSSIQSKFSKVFFLYEDKQIFELKSTAWNVEAYDAKSGLQRVRKSWPSQILELVRVELFGKETIDHAGLPTEEKIFLPYIEAGVSHGDPDAPTKRIQKKAK